MRSKISKMFVLSCLILMIPSYSRINAQDNIRGVRKAGTYFIELAADDENGESKVERYRAHIRFPKTVLNYDKKEGIDAHDIIYVPGSFEPDDLNAIAKEAGVHAWSMDTGDEIGNLKVHIEPSEPRTGAINTVVFSTQAGTSVKVNVFEQEVRHMMLEEVYMDQSSVMTSRLRMMSPLLILLTVIPILGFIIIFKLLSKKTKETLDLLQ